MDGFNYDAEKLRQAVELMIDTQWGDARIEKARSAVSLPPSRQKFFSGPTEPLNELVRLGRYSMPAFSRLVQLALDKRAMIVQPEKRQEWLSRMRESTRKTRVLEKLFTQIQEAKLGRRMTAEEKKEMLTAERKKWRVFRLKFSQTHSNYKGTRDAYDAANSELEGRLRSDLIYWRSQGKIKK